MRKIAAIQEKHDQESKSPSSEGLKAQRKPNLHFQMLEPIKEANG
jgi:hypothetical protein